MRLVTYNAGGGFRAGIDLDGWIVDTEAAAISAGLTHDPDFDWTSNRQILQISSKGQSELECAARELVSTDRSRQSIETAQAIHASNEVRLGPPIPDPEKIICLGLNYRSHAEEAGLAVPEVPILFAKYSNTLTGPTSPVVLPPPEVSQEIDYEAELAAVIGRRCKAINIADALSYVAGYMAFNDVSARDIQMRGRQWLSGKSLDTFAPCGPALVVDEIRDPQNLNLSTRVNGAILQMGNTRDMIFPVAEILAYVSQLMTLQPGDILATGTPAGVGFTRTPPIYLRAGDIVEVEIEGIGKLVNPVISSNP